MWLAGLRRLALLVVACVALTALGGLFSAAIGNSFERSFSLGLYLLGAFLMIAGFFVGNRGPSRVRSETAGSTFTPFPLFGSRQLRWATLGEQNDAINHSAVFIGLGVILVLLGIFVDSRHSLF